MGQSVDIFMPVFVGDYLKKTTLLSCEEHGAYCLLLFSLWQNGGALPHDSKKLSRACRLSQERFIEVWEEIEAFFSVEDGLIMNHRVSEELEKAMKRREIASNNGKNGGRPKGAQQPEKSNNNPEETQRVSKTITETEPRDKAKPNPEKSSSPSPSPSPIHTPLSLPKPSLNPSLVDKQQEVVAFQALDASCRLVESKAPEARPIRKRGLTPLTEPNDAEFAEWWSAYPRKDAKIPSFMAWEKTRKIRPPVAEMIATLEWQKQSAAWTKDNGQFIPMPSTYLNQGRWTDEAPPAPKTYEQRMADELEEINKRHRARGHEC